MRRYDDPVEVRKGMVGGVEGPEQFLWRGRLWKVFDVVAHWVETGPWWQSPGVRAVLGSEDPVENPVPVSAADAPRLSDGLAKGAAGGGAVVQADLTAEREIWRVEAGRGISDAGHAGRGVFDLAFDWAQGGWQLVRCVD